MRKGKDKREPSNGKGPWTDRVTVSPEGGGIAYRPNEVCTTNGELAVQLALRMGNKRVQRIDELGPFWRLKGIQDPVGFSRELRLERLEAEPNYVAFADSCGQCCPPHPAVAACGPNASPIYASPIYASPIYASPIYASPIYASPIYASPIYASPIYASPIYASDYRETGVRKSSARPAAPDGALEVLSTTRPSAKAPRVVVLDTGLAGGHLRPDALPSTLVLDAAPLDVDNPDETGDLLLDPAAGHGTFIAGIIQRVAPGCVVEVRRVLSTFGDGDEWGIAQAIDAAAASGAHLLNLSFSAYTLDQPAVMAWAVRRAQDAGMVVVASAGNDGTCRPTFPSALPGVVGVGAIGPNGPAPFSNYGPWVRACAPGVDLVSTFFKEFVGATPPPPEGPDPDNFTGWARWSGTSFSAPVVVGALAREMMRGVSAGDAVKRVIDEPHLMRIPNLGTVVNVL